MKHLVTSVALVGAIAAYQNHRPAETCNAHYCDGMRVIYVVDGPPLRRNFVDPVVTKADIMLLQITIWMEARSGGVDGMEAIAHVVLNRMQAKGWSLRQVLWEPYQFTAWCKHDKNRKAVRNFRHLTGLDRLMWTAAGDIAKDALTGTLPDPTHGARWYHTTGVHPDWAKAKHRVALIGAHIFYTKTI